MASDWYFKINNVEQGPFSPERLKQLAREGKITPDTPVKIGVAEHWHPARQLKGLFPETNSRGVPPAATPLPKQPVIPPPMPPNAPSPIPSEQMDDMAADWFAEVPTPIPTQVKSPGLAYDGPVAPPRSPFVESPATLSRPAGSVASQSSATKSCPYCGEEILAVAKKCKHCGEFLDAIVREATKPTKKPSEALGIIIMLLPLASAAIIWFWVGSMSLLQNPGSTLMGIIIGTIIVTSILMAIEASQLGMGGKRNGKATTGPVGWFVCGLLLWVVVLPAYLYWRSKFGAKNYFFGGLVSALLFLGVDF